MRSYTNSDGMKVKVSQEHLDTAVEIYEELRKLSPSLSVSWEKHKEMMEANGFFDSDSNENYRLLIRRERDAQGVLPSKEKHADMLADSKLDALKQEIGLLRTAKQDAQQDFSRLNRLKRETSQEIYLGEILAEGLKDFEINLSEIKPNAIEFPEDNTMLVCISDLHYGYEGECVIGEYNTDIAKDLMKEYADKVVALGKREKVNKIYVVCLGDTIEGKLRNQSMFDTRRDIMEQTVEATELIVEFLVTMSQEFHEVKYAGVAGNHDRLTPKYSDALHGESIMFASNAIVQSTMKGVSNFTYVPVGDIYNHVFEINGKNILATHGDSVKVKNDNVLAEQSLLYNKTLDLIVAGHFHGHQVREVGYDKYVCVFGSFKGSDDFSVKIGRSSSRSQGCIIFAENGDFDIRQVKIGG